MLVFKMYLYVTSFALFSSFVQHSYGDSTNIGSCPLVEPMPGFRMNRFLGKWFAIQKTATSASCLRFEITQKEQDKYEFTEIEPHSTILSGFRHEHHSSGYLTVPDPAEPARMKLELPFDFGSTKFIVFMTDYDHYAAIFTCKKFPLFHRWSVAILSRSETINMDYVDQIRTRIASYNIDPFTLSIVTQKNCPKPEEEGVIYKTITSSIKNVANGISSKVF